MIAGLAAQLKGEGVIWTGERNRQQGRLVAEMHEAAAAAAVPAERVAVIAGGLPGSDKAAALAEAGIDPSRSLTVRIADNLRRMAARQLLPPAHPPGRPGGPGGGRAVPADASRTRARGSTVRGQARRAARPDRRPEPDPGYLAGVLARG